MDNNAVHSNGSATLPRGFRFHHEEPTTPEPPRRTDESQPPSPPRPTRLRLKRRNVSTSLEGPTETFLASVNAADIPIPTIEIPSVIEDFDMPDSEGISTTTSGLLAPSSFDTRPFSPPKTPVPMLQTEDSDLQRPDWSKGASSEPEYFDRPMSAQSSMSDYSDDDSFYSGSRASRPSDDGSCTSPESDIADPFQFPPVSKSRLRETTPSYLKQELPLNAQLHSKTRKNAPWSSAMSEHLWRTYMIYLQDPTVTPFRLGASAIPPEGVCHRVAREARRSWKGPKQAVVARFPSRLHPARASSHDTEKSGSLTPTGDALPKTYAKWPHSGVSTRNHLRELCKSNGTSIPRQRHMQSRSPTPFTKGVTRSHLRTPEPSRPSSFNTNDIALSLTTSTAESMQPDGPLARLSDFDASYNVDKATCGFQSTSLGFGNSMSDYGRCRRLGSPFIVRTYGPSSSKYIHPYDRPDPPRTQSDHANLPQLKSPVRFDRPRSLNNTQKRRATRAFEDEMSPNEAVVRPSILNEQLFGTDIRDSRRVRSRGFSLGDASLRNRMPGLFDYPPEPTTSLMTSFNNASNNGVKAVSGAPSLLPSATFGPTIPRLRSPFSEATANTFPRRLFQDGVIANQTVRKSAFATMHQTRRSIESFDFGEGGPSLQSRLSRKENRLGDIREKDIVAPTPGV
ncbi:hypothetical protein BP5796_05868 [Coleophoma crateriformis]|uniref:Uncharacterized protein n=1 Tax=Coleophoma crateriformis TaxID=565419 RepID=A0A3D8RVL2_9HELO|nr:hypothetical protein BP5796_05868 [Coleophoma crateriformis]